MSTLLSTGKVLKRALPFKTKTGHQIVMEVCGNTITYRGKGTRKEIARTTHTEVMRSQFMDATPMTPEELSK